MNTNKQPSELDKAIELQNAIDYIQNGRRGHWTSPNNPDQIVLTAAKQSRELQERLKELTKDESIGFWGRMAAIKSTEAMKLKEQSRADKELIEKFVEAADTAIGTVECASIDLNTQEELPWYKQTRRVLSLAHSLGYGKEKK